MKIQKIIDALTNGVGETPYCQRKNGVMTVFVADEQVFCTIPVGELDTEIAEAICEVGLALMRFQVAVNLALFCEDIDSIREILLPLMR